ncbi:hypothetical protein [Buchananella felis]|uniref:hypothetical protein n=2 Tax=Buchananella felis TaxID=3231492 RepID=UPI003527D49D
MSSAQQSTGSPQDPGQQKQTASSPQSPEARGLCVPMGSGWTALDLTASENELVKQVEDLSSIHFPESQRARTWLGEIAEQVALNDGRSLAFLFACADTPHGLPAGIPISAASFWHYLSTPNRPITLPVVARSIRAAALPGDEFEQLRLAGVCAFRRVRIASGQAEEDGESTPVLCVDYWIAAPGDRAIVHIAFSTPWTQFAKELVDYSHDALNRAQWSFYHDNDFSVTDLPCPAPIDEDALLALETTSDDDLDQVTLAPTEEDSLDPWWANLSTQMSYIVTLVSEWAQTQSGVLLTSANPEHAHR